MVLRWGNIGGVVFHFCQLTGLLIALLEKEKSNFLSQVLMNFY